MLGNPPGSTSPAPRHIWVEGCIYLNSTGFVDSGGIFIFLFTRLCREMVGVW